jgi:hypothetical protein
MRSDGLKHPLEYAVMDPKPRPNEGRYIAVLRSMSAEERLAKVFELSDWGKRVFKDGVRSRNPNASEEEVHRLFLEGLAECHNRNY